MYVACSWKSGKPSSPLLGRLTVPTTAQARTDRLAVMLIVEFALESTWKHVAEAPLEQHAHPELARQLLHRILLQPPQQPPQQQPQQPHEHEPSQQNQRRPTGREWKS